MGIPPPSLYCLPVEVLFMSRLIGPFLQSRLNLLALLTTIHRIGQSERRTDA